MRQERVILLTRRSGPREPVRFAITWQGNDGAFISSDSISLPLGEPVPLKVAVDVDVPGVYSAIAHLTGPSLPGIAVSIPATIVVPNEFTAERLFSWSDKVMLDRPAGRRNLFFRVPEGAKVFSVSMNAPRKGISLYLVPPHNPDAGPHNMQTTELAGMSEVTIEAPAPGVWEAVLHDQKDSKEFDWVEANKEYLPPTAVEVSAKVLGVSATIEGRVVRVENRLAVFEGGVTSMELGGLRSSRATLQPRQSLVYNIDVEPGQQLLVAEIGRLNGANLDADLHLFDCSRGTCTISRRSEKRGAQERVVVERPTAGKWKAVVLASGNEQGTMELAYTDYYTHPKLGTLSTTDARLAREPSKVWHAKLNIWRAGEPRRGYQPAGVIRIMGEDLRLRQMEAHASRDTIPGRATYLELKLFLLDNEAVPAVAILPLSR